MIFARMILSAAFALGLGAPAMADLTLQCDFPSELPGSWVRGPVVFNHVAGEDTALVNSDVIGAFIGKPIEARVVKEAPGQLVLSWEVKAKDKINQYFRLKFTLNVLSEGAKASYSARPLSYDNSWRSEGKCVKVRRK